MNINDSIKSLQKDHRIEDLDTSIRWAAFMDEIKDCSPKKSIIDDCIDTAMSKNSIKKSKRPHLKRIIADAIMLYIENVMRVERNISELDILEKLYEEKRAKLNPYWNPKDINSPAIVEDTNENTISTSN